jgi:hypothetical protein
MNPIYTQSNPQIILRSKLFSLNTATYFSCNSSYTIAYKWSLKLIQNLSSQISIDLSSNPSWQSTSLVIQAYTLSYGLYAFNFQTNVTITKANNVVVALTNNLTTYVQIIPTGFAVYGLQNGVSGLLIGTQQSFSLNPALYSLDLDSLVQPSSLQYKFYCFTINKNSITSVNTSQSIDLFTYKNNSLLQMNSNSTCFQSNSKLYITSIIKNIKI